MRPRRSLRPLRPSVNIFKSTFTGLMQPITLCDAINTESHTEGLDFHPGYTSGGVFKRYGPRQRGTNESPRPTPWRFPRSVYEDKVGSARECTLSFVLRSGSRSTNMKLCSPSKARVHPQRKRYASHEEAREAFRQIGDVMFFHLKRSYMLAASCDFLAGMESATPLPPPPRAGSHWNSR